MLLECNNLTFYYEKKKPIFEKINFKINRGEICCILGLNGCGKSTLLANLMQVKKPTSGNVKLNGNFSYLPQNFTISFDFNVLDIVIMGRIRYIGLFQKPCKNDIKIATQALEFLGIKHLKDSKFNILSGGQKQLVLFARAIASKSDILFLDEPMSALDLSNQNMVLKIIKQLKNETNLSIIFTTHDPRHAINLCDKILIMFNNVEYIFDKTSKCLTEENLKKLYGINFSIKHNNNTNKSTILTTFDV